MPFRNSDIRLVNGDIDSTTKAIQDYLSNINFNSIVEKDTEYVAEIKGENQQKSILRLFLKANPQIINFHIEKKPDKTVQIEAKFDLFRKFRFFYYVILCSLTSGFGIFYKIANVYGSTNTTDEFISFLIWGFIGAVFLLLAVTFEFRTLFSSSTYGDLINLLYEDLSEKGFADQIVIHSGCDFPDFWQGVFTFLGIIFVSLADKNFLQNIPKNPDDPFYLFIFIIIGFIAILIALAIVMYINPEISYRFLFALLGIALCIPMALYGNIPTFNIIMGELLQKGSQVHEMYSKKINELPLNEKNRDDLLETNYSESKKLMKIALSLTLFIWFVVSFIIAALLWNIIRLPIRLTCHFDRFKQKHKDTIYHQALEPGKSSKIFGIIIILLWAALSIANIAGVYFSFSILEKTFLDTNYLFQSSIGTMFSDNIRLAFIFFLKPLISMNSISFLHRATLTIYSIPMILMLFLVLRKNWISYVEERKLLSKAKSEKDKKFEEQLIQEVSEICNYARVRMPIIRVRNSDFINAESKSINFPAIKNILVVTKGALDNLSNHDGEIDAFLAHEIWHLKKHTLKLKLLCLLSDYSLFGNGFLALLQNSFKVEKEADDFAIKWLKEKNKPISAFKSLLERQEEVNGTLKAFQPSIAGNSLNFAMIDDDDYRKSFIETYNYLSWQKKIWSNLKSLYKMYFDTKIYSYLHPSNSQRIIWAMNQGVKKA